MGTHYIHFMIKHSKNEFGLTIVNKPSVFESLRSYCTNKVWHFR